MIRTIDFKYGMKVRNIDTNTEGIVVKTNTYYVFVKFNDGVISQIDPSKLEVLKGENN